MSVFDLFRNKVLQSDKDKEDKIIDLSDAPQ